MIATNAYYLKNKSRHRAVAQLWYLLHKADANEKSREYYMKNFTKWKEYNSRNPAATTGTGLLGSHRNEDMEMEQELVSRELRRLGLRR